MARLSWATPGSHFYEAGVDHGVLYVDGLSAVPWVGLISVEEAPVGGAARPIYIDGVKFSNTSAKEEFEGTLTAYTFPDQFSACDGTAEVFPGMFLKHQRRKPFGLSYQTKVGNEIQGLSLGYKIHILYNLLATPSQQTNQSLGDDVEAINFVWNLTSRPTVTPGYRPTAHIVIDSRYTHPSALASVEQFLYGDDMTVPSLPTFSDLVTIFDMYGELVVVDHGDGTFALIGPSTMLSAPGDGTFVVNSPAVVDNGDGSFTVTS